MTRPVFETGYLQESIEGLFFCKQESDPADCRKLLEDLGCRTIAQIGSKLKIIAPRRRLKELKARYMAPEDDTFQITSRLKDHFTNILIGGLAH